MSWSDLSLLVSSSSRRRPPPFTFPDVEFVALAIMTYWVPDVRNLAQVSHASQAFTFEILSLLSPPPLSHLSFPFPLSILKLQQGTGVVHTPIMPQYPSASLLSPGPAEPPPSIPSEYPQIG